MSEILPGLDVALTRYRGQRLRGVSREVARKNFFSRLAWNRPASSIFRARSEINDRLEQIEGELAGSDEPTPAA